MKQEASCSSNQGGNHPVDVHRGQQLQNGLWTELKDQLGVSLRESASPTGSQPHRRLSLGSRDPATRLKVKAKTPGPKRLDRSQAEAQVYKGWHLPKVTKPGCG